MKKLDNYLRNLEALERAYGEDAENELIQSGIIQKFSLQFELGWKLLKELLLYEGRVEARSGSPREILKTAYAVYDFMDEKVWLEMLRARNDMSHQYDGQAAKRLTEQILRMYIPEFRRLRDEIRKRYGDVLDAL